MNQGREARVRAPRSMLDLGPRARAWFALAYVGVMAGVVVSAQYRPDHVFGFQMFNETSTLNIHLFRRVRGQHGLEPLVDGTFYDQGVEHTFSWRDRVHDPVLCKLDTTVHAKYGLAGQLFRLQLALDDFVRRMPRASQTVELVALVETNKNGRDTGVVRLKAARP